METSQLEEIIACLPTDRTVFRYGRDDYALLLLSHFAGDGKPIAELKRSPFRGLLDKRFVKQLISSYGNGHLTKRDFHYAMANDRQNFILTVGKWDKDCSAFSQTTRNNGNLVLQLNFNTAHDQAFQRLIGNNALDYFQNDGHPILMEGERRYYRNTLGWARLDIELETGEVLIEEIQNDWLRRARHYQKIMSRYMAQNPDYRKKMGITATQENIEKYVQHILGPFYRIWDEAILTAAIWFCIEELGIRHIYYHTFETGNRLKQIIWTHPPKSLYTTLPRKFCFRMTDRPPEFLARSRIVKRKLKKVKNPQWFELAM